VAISDVDRIFRVSGGRRHEPAIDSWLDSHPGELGGIARRWFERIRGCGEDVRELMHDGAATACIGDAPFAYVNVFKGHVNVGFFNGAELADPAGLLEGRGRQMRHVKLRPGGNEDVEALSTLVDTAYAHLGLCLDPFR